jgi:hypothetical protein
MDNTSPPQIITLNVAGTKVQTYQSTLAKLPFFEAYLKRWKSGDSNEIFVDYDYSLFVHLLNKLRDDAYVIPLTENVKAMCNYFGYSIQIPVYVIDEIHLRILNTVKFKTIKYTMDTTKQELLMFSVEPVDINEKIDSCGITKCVFFNDSIKILNTGEGSVFTEYFKPYNMHIEFQKTNSNTRDIQRYLLRKPFISILQNIPNLNIHIYGRNSDVFIKSKTLKHI